VSAVFDEGVPHDLLQQLRDVGTEVVGFPKAWKGTKNGQLMKRVEQAGFRCLVTSDKNMPYQQNLAQFPFAVVVLPSNKLDALQPIAERISAVIASAPPGAATWVD
jgi:hypothetical protein